MFDKIDGFDFSQLNLDDVQAASAPGFLPPGRYVCKTSDAKVEATKDKGGNFVAVRLRDVTGKGTIIARLNVRNRSAEATRIGLEQLKALLVCGDHPDPNNIGALGVSSINGLTVGVIVKHEMYNGEDRSSVSGFCKPSDVSGYEGTVPETRVGSDDIPF
jgi:hypothetical protein